MTNSSWTPGVVPGRLPAEAYALNFADLHPPLDPHEAAVAADRCYFCHDAPCITACPTSIDIPLFIRQISTGTPEAAARTIFEQNILGGMCARVCPTETLCEEACVREAAEGKPVEIGRLQRYATDTLMKAGVHPFTRGPATGKRVAVVGAGPAGLSCAHRLAMLGHDVTIVEAKEKPGGLNEYGIASYKTVEGFAQAEVAWLMQIGGIELRNGVALGRDVTLDELADSYDAVFLGIGLPGAYDIAGVAGNGIGSAVEFIRTLRQSTDLSGLPIGRNVVVIGGGMTAIDAAVQSRLLGAENVAVVYRRGRERMAASPYEQELAASKGVRLVFNAQPVAAHHGADGALEAVEFAYVADTPEGLRETGETIRLPADQVHVAIGQWLEPLGDALADVELDGTKLAVFEGGKVAPFGNVWAGGDCAAGGEDLTVTAVAEGRDAAMSIHAALSAA
ncbi:NAD(P)-dependent oxidoreductase [Oceaniglobus roseus]|uniref:NAD(P)-dependent oxidoreductase n=1 Tax=Oceaniglobus roseus TaxID=1737570 RepID=UPI000C7F2746|nr:NAD(P)-dependent oxidoreductase [Kandeliimicrobium roseum]